MFSMQTISYFLYAVSRRSVSMQVFTIPCAAQVGMMIETSPFVVSARLTR
jgi:hypothetical protein